MSLRKRFGATPRAVRENLQYKALQSPRPEEAVFEGRAHLGNKGNLHVQQPSDARKSGVIHGKRKESKLHGGKPHKYLFSNHRRTLVDGRLRLSMSALLSIC